MKRRLLNLAAASLLLAVAIVALWIHSYGRREGIGCSWHTSTKQHGWAVESLYSSLDVQGARSSDRGPAIAPRYEYYDYTPRESTIAGLRHWFPFPPVQYQHASNPIRTYDYWAITVADWLLIPPTLVLPTVAIVRHRRRRRRETNNLCPTCGYDLRATPDRCPECGTAIPASVAEVSKGSPAR